MTRRPFLAALLALALAALGCAVQPGAERNPAFTAPTTTQASGPELSLPATVPPPEHIPTPGLDEATGNVPSPSPPQLAALAIDDRPYAGPPYRREDWQPRGWTDPDGDGCDAREQALRDASLDPPIIGKGCEILAGRWSLVYVEGETDDPGALDLDHVFALGLAQRSGGATWTSAQRAAFTQDPLNLLPVQASANRSKGDKSPAEWQPKTPAGRCIMATRYVAVAVKYRLAVTTETRDALGRGLEEC